MKNKNLKLKKDLVFIEDLVIAQFVVDVEIWMIIGEDALYVAVN